MTTPNVSGNRYLAELQALANAEKLDIRVELAMSVSLQELLPGSLTSPDVPPPLKARVLLAIFHKVVDRAYEDRKADLEDERACRILAAAALIGFVRKGPDELICPPSLSGGQRSSVKMNRQLLAGSWFAKPISDRAVRSGESMYLATLLDAFYEFCRNDDAVRDLAQRLGITLQEPDSSVGPADQLSDSTRATRSIPDDRSTLIEDGRPVPELRQPAVAAEASPLYVPREALRASFTAALQAEPATKLIAFVGLPGMGKSWLAEALTTEIAGSVVPVIRMIGDKPSLMDLSAAFATCHIDLQGAITNDPVACLARLLSSDKAPRYVVLDNLDSTAQLNRLVPRLFQPTVIATCRRAEQPPSGCRIIEVGKMTRAQSMAMARRRLPRLTVEESAQLVATLHDYPLLIDYACRLLARYPIPMSTFSSDLRNRLGDIAVSVPLPESEATLLSVIIELAEQLRQANSRCFDLLRFIVFAGAIQAPAGALALALSWQGGTLLTITECVQYLRTLEEYFHIEYEQIQSFDLRGIGLHPLVAQLLMEKVFTDEDWTIAAEFMFKAAVTHGQAAATVQGDNLWIQLGAWWSRVMIVLATFLLTPGFQRQAERLPTELRNDMETWLCYSLLYLDTTRSVAPRSAYKWAEQRTVSQTEESLTREYSKIFATYVLR